MSKVPISKRINVVQVKLVRERSIMYKERQIRSSQDAYELIFDFLGDVDREHFILLCLDVKNQQTCIQTVHIGSLNSSIVHPREILKSAILSNSASIIVAYNHPSEITKPSTEDIEVTKRLEKAGHILGISLLDNLVISSTGYSSLRESGLID